MKIENIIFILTLVVIGALGFYPFLSPGTFDNFFLPATSKTASSCERFMEYAAVNFDEPQLCDKIAPDSVGGTSMDPGHEIDYLRSDCYLDLAVNEHNTDLCAKVKPISTPVLNGSQENQSECLDEVKNTNSTMESESLTDDQLEPLMTRLGYTTSTFLQITIDTINGPEYDNSWNDYLQDLEFWDNLTTQKNDFLNRVENLQCH